MSNDNKIGNGPSMASMIGPRVNTTLTVPAQTTKFGDTLQRTVSAAAGIVGQGVNTMAQFIPGGSVVSAAVSSLTTMMGGGGGGGGGAAGAPYSTAMVAGVNVPTINTTVDGGAGGGGGVPNIGGPGVGVPGAGNPVGPDYAAGNNGGGVGTEYNGLLQNMYEQQRSLLNTQVSLQRENIVFTTISNVLKNRHDTAKNAVGNIR